MNDGNIPLVNHVKYLGVIFDKRITWRLHTEITEARAFRTFIRIYSLFKSESLSTDITLTLHKALIGSVMIYAYCAWELALDTCLLKLQRLQNKVLQTIKNVARCISARDFYTALNHPYAEDYIIKLCSNKQKSYNIMRMIMFEVSDKAKPDRENVKRLKLGGG
jgi:hypothetical protein